MFGKSKAEYGSKHLIEHNEALMRDLSHQKAVLKQNQDELIRSLKEGVDLKAKLKESEAQMTTLTSGFVSLDQAHSVLQLQHRKRQEELLRINERLSRVNADLVVRAEGLQQEVARLQTSESIREESLSGNTIARMQDEAQNLRNDNERLHTEIKDTESRNGDLKSQVGDLTSQLNDVKSQLDECNKIIEEKDAELESVKTAQKARDSDAAGEKLRLEADLAKAREEKRLIEQAMARLPMEAHQRHEQEIDTLRNELEASRRKADFLQRMVDTLSTSSVSSDALMPNYSRAKIENIENKNRHPEVRGVCGLCQKTVYNNQARCKTSWGSYMHEACAPLGRDLPETEEVQEKSNMAASTSGSLHVVASSSREPTSDEVTRELSGEMQTHANLSRISQLSVSPSQLHVVSSTFNKLREREFGPRITDLSGCDVPACYAGLGTSRSPWRLADSLYNDSATTGWPRPSPGR